MPPVIDVDDEGFADGAEKRRKHREIHALPRHANEHELESEYHRDENERWKTNARNPSAGHERVQE